MSAITALTLITEQIDMGPAQWRETSPTNYNNYIQQDGELYFKYL